MTGVRIRWPFLIALTLGLVPVVMFALIVVVVVLNALPALDDPGLAGLASGRFASVYTTGEGLYGLLPALAGSILVTVVAIGLALPVALAMAILATEFPAGVLGRALVPLLGLLSGIPPIVYGIASATFIPLLMIPKFAAGETFATFTPATIGADPATWPPADVPYSPGGFPWDVSGTNNSTLLGGILIALLLVPFLTPLLLDAIRSVPLAGREASLALGATRVHTLRRVILAQAMPGLVAAVGLAMLKALGDSLIVGFAVGWEANTVPVPAFDVLERTSTLAAEGAGLVGQFDVGAFCSGAACSVGYASALLLLGLAALVVVTATVLQARLHRAVAR